MHKSNWPRKLILAHKSRSRIYAGRSRSHHFAWRCPGNLLIPSWTKWLPLRRRHFQMQLYLWKGLYSINISLKFVPESPIANKLALDQIIAWRRTDDKPLLNQCWPIFPTFCGYQSTDDVTQISGRGEVSRNCATLRVLSLSWPQDDCHPALFAKWSMNSNWISSVGSNELYDMFAIDITWRRWVWIIDISIVCSKTFSR